MTIDLNKLEKLRTVAADETLTPALREAAQKQLTALGEPEPTVQPEQPPEPEQPKSVKGIFDDLLAAGAAEAREQAAATDREQRVCGTCYAQQPVSNATCELCGEIPGKWLVPSKLDPEQSMFSRMARESNIDALKTAQRSGWATTKERQRFTALHLRLREAVERRAQRQADATSKVTEELPWKVTDEQIQAASRSYDLQLEKLKENK